MNKAFEEFRELVLNDKSMQKDLQAIAESDNFVSRVVELARLSGFEFTASDIEDEMRSARQKWFERGV